MPIFSPRISTRASALIARCSAPKSSWTPRLLGPQCSDWPGIGADKPLPPRSQGLGSGRGPSSRDRKRCCRCPGPRRESDGVRVSKRDDGCRSVRGHNGGWGRRRFARALPDESSSVDERRWSREGRMERRRPARNRGRWRAWGAIGRREALHEGSRYHMDAGGCTRTTSFSLSVIRLRFSRTSRNSGSLRLRGDQGMLLLRGGLRSWLTSVSSSARISTSFSFRAVPRRSAGLTTRRRYDFRQSDSSSDGTRVAGGW